MAPHLPCRRVRPAVRTQRISEARLIRSSNWGGEDPVAKPVRPSSFTLLKAVKSETLCPVQPWPKTERPIVKRVRAFPKLVPQSKKHESDPPNVFVFCEKSTGAARFHAESNSDPNYIIERMAGLLAVQCLVRGSDPSDFAILVPAATTLGNRLVSRAKELLEARARGRRSFHPQPAAKRDSTVRHVQPREQGNRLRCSTSPYEL